MTKLFKILEKKVKKITKYVHFSPLFMNRFFVSLVYTTDTVCKVQ